MKIGFLLIFFSSVSAFSTPPLPELSAVAEYAESHSSIAQLVNHLEKTKLISTTEAKATHELFAEYDLGPSAQMPKLKIEGEKIKWGDLHLERIAKDRFKTNSGQILNYNSNESFDSNLRKTIRKLSGKKTSFHKLDFFFSPAQAYTDNRGLLEQVAVGLSIGMEHAFKTAATAYYGIAGAAVNAAGLPLETMAVGLRNLTEKGKVTCKGSKYFINPGYSRVQWKRAQEFYKKEADYLKKGLISKSGTSVLSEGYSSHLYGAYSAGLEMLINTFDPKEPHAMQISQDFLNAAWKKSEAPSCNPENAQILQASIREKSGQIERDLLTGLIAGGTGSAGPAKARQ